MTVLHHAHLINQDRVTANSHSLAFSFEMGQSLQHNYYHAYRLSLAGFCIRI